MYNYIHFYFLMLLLIWSNMILFINRIGSGRDPRDSWWLTQTSGSASTVPIRTTKCQLNVQYAINVGRTRGSQTLKMKSKTSIRWQRPWDTIKKVAWSPKPLPKFVLPAPILWLVQNGHVRLVHILIGQKLANALSVIG